MKTFEVYIIDHEIVCYQNILHVKAKSKEEAEKKALASYPVNQNGVIHIDSMRINEWDLNQEALDDFTSGKFKMFYLYDEEETKEIPSKEEQQMADKLNRIAQLENELRKLKSEIE